ncbi:hypothetical protein HYALB_00000848 [Hymenoscyphus albidus]|uniref:Rap-GAP domain-containing protein n=1 Tax=Hymenoscyphus albidus TaxID=595503 RepID=A0A9N9LEH7_9HELO|nr:hypothetical protein HYALB_00000848 [Hymenoscyphus albidus]
MSPASGDIAQPPPPPQPAEPKPSSGLASVFKSLTGSKLSRPNNARSTAQSSQQPTAAGNLQSAIYGGPPNYEKLYEQLKIGNSLPGRIAAAESLRYAIDNYPLNAVTAIFNEGKDLIESTKSREARQAGFGLLTACVKNSTSTDPERMAYFSVLTAPANPQDFHLQVRSVMELSKHGKDLSGFHYRAIPLLTTWMHTAFNLTANARKIHLKNPSTTPLEEEAILYGLFAFLTDLIKFSFVVSSEEVTAKLLEEILSICSRTPLSDDLKACISVVDAIMTYGEVPSYKLPDCVKVLSSVLPIPRSPSVPKSDDLKTKAWKILRNFSRSHNGQAVVRILLEILHEPSHGEKTADQNYLQIRGAMCLLRKLFAKNGQDSFPLVPFTALVRALDSVTAFGHHAKIDGDVLELVLSIFGNKCQELKHNVMEEDWTLLFEVVIKCSEGALETSDGRPVPSRSQVSSPHGTSDGGSEPGQSTNLAQSLYNFIVRIEKLLVEIPGNGLFQREDCIRFFAKVHAHLPESCAKLVIDHYTEYRYCYPSDLGWKTNVNTIVEAFFGDRSQPAHIRLHALKAVTDVFGVIEMLDDHEDPDIVQTFVSAILDNIGDEKDIAILQKLVAFAVAVARNADNSLFDYVIRAVRGSVMSDRLQSPLASPPSSRQSLLSISRPITSPTQSSIIQTPSNVVTKGLVQIFMRVMDTSAYKSVKVFEELLWIARSHECEIDARLSAMKMLFRLRADWAHRIHLVISTESDGLAASLFRTSASLARKQAADEAAHQHRVSRNDDLSNSKGSRNTSAPSIARQSHRSSSGLVRTIQRNHQMWMYPDSEALPEDILKKASSLLVSLVGIEDPQNDYKGVRADGNVLTHAQNPDGEKCDEPLPKVLQKRILDIGTYLDTIAGLLQNGCDWEVYSFILVHLPSQLTNQALFRGSITQIRRLREVLCDLLKNNSFQEPPISSGLRKSDVAICLFQVLNMTMGYHQNFSKPEQDDIVRTFLQGIGSTWERTAKCCIHALTICSHEIPGSTSKQLVTILQKMSTIITQSHVAIHILEFLACLARLPDLYVNFREEEYRTVFAICFRYLQYVRDQNDKESKDISARSSSSIARSSGPALTDHGLSESNFQPNSSDDLPQYVYALAYHVIIFWFLSLKLTDRAVHVSWITRNLVSTDSFNKESIDEQAQVTLDFMQRVTYADVDESAADPTFTSERFGKIEKKRWIVGKSIVTVEQATRGGWAQIKKRQPSGTSCYIIRERFSRPPPHQTQYPNEPTRDTKLSDAKMVFPSHLLLQLTASVPQVGDTVRPIPLPTENPGLERAIKTFDRNFTVDGHKVGVIYIAENQTHEVEILANIMGSGDYTSFLSGLGTLTKLKGATFNTQGLDRVGDSDGQYAFCWRDRVTEIVFHVTTQIPTNLESDPQCIGKKRHIGNDFVNIIFNNSGLPFKFDTFPSEFNYVNIVITPESRASFVATRTRTEANAKNAFYKVQVMSKPGFPEISPAAETKIMSLAVLPGFIRLLALNASVFSLVWANREGGEHVSSWRNRLREINKLREKYNPKAASTPLSTPVPSNGNVRDSIQNLRRSSVATFLTSSNSEPVSQRSSLLSPVNTEVGVSSTEGSIVEDLDFSKWS